MTTYTGCITDTYMEAGLWPIGDGPDDAEPHPTWLDRWAAWAPVEGGYVVAWSDAEDVELRLQVLTTSGVIRSEVTFNATDEFGPAMFVAAVAAIASRSGEQGQ